MERLTKRDLEFLRFIARVGVAQPNNLITRFGISRATAYRRMKLLSDLGHLSRTPNVSPDGDIYSATRSGIAMTGLPLRVAKVNSYTMTHSFAMTEVVGRLERIGIDCLTEREIFAYRRTEEIDRYVFPLLRPKNRWATTHRPDIVCEVPGEDTFVAIEVELSPKENDRWDDTLRSYANRVGINGFAGVFYLVGPGAERKRLSRRAQDTMLGDRFQLLDIAAPDFVPSLQAILAAGPQPPMRSAA
jgi:hypothetical protein